MFAGLNPSLYAARVGHYFARPHRFWPALAASGLLPFPVGPEDDARLLQWGLGVINLAHS